MQPVSLNFAAVIPIKAEIQVKLKNMYYPVRPGNGKKIEIPKIPIAFCLMFYYITSRICQFTEFYYMVIFELCHFIVTVAPINLSIIHASSPRWGYYYNTIQNNTILY